MTIIDSNEELLQTNDIQDKMTSGFFTKPIYLFAVTILSLFLSETLVMIIISYLPPISVLKEALLDSMILTIVVFPMIYLFVFRPMRIHIEQRKKVEEERAKLIEQLQESLSEIKILRGIIPICAWCKKVRNDQGFWQQVEAYVRDHSDAEFSHGICPDCNKRYFPSHKPINK